MSTQTQLVLTVIIATLELAGLTWLIVKHFDFKKILASDNFLKFPTAFHTVDMAIMQMMEPVKKGVDGKTLHLLLIQKKNESGVWRFPGGFVDPNDGSAEDAAIREAFEETHMTVRPNYLGSFKIDDPRFRTSKNKIITSFFACGTTDVPQNARPGDDAAVAKWIPVEEILSNKKLQNPIHTQLFDCFANNLNRFLK